MQIIIYGSNINIINEWNERHSIQTPILCFDMEELNAQLTKLTEYILIVDYNSVSHYVNKWISSNTLPQNVIVLETAPEIATGKMLILRGVKAYGNSRMHLNHFSQMIDTVANNKIWTYPELTASLTKNKKNHTFSKDTIDFINNRLTQKETQVLFLILDGLINDAIATELGIKTRTVKAHVSSIFSKLHVNDRVSLVLLLK